MSNEGGTSLSVGLMLKAVFVSVVTTGGGFAKDSKYRSKMSQLTFHFEAQFVQPVLAHGLVLKTRSCRDLQQQQQKWNRRHGHPNRFLSHGRKC